MLTDLINISLFITIWRLAWLRAGLLWMLVYDKIALIYIGRTLSMNWLRGILAAIWHLIFIGSISLSNCFGLLATLILFSATIYSNCLIFFLDPKFRESAGGSILMRIASELDLRLFLTESWLLVNILIHIVIFTLSPCLTTHDLDTSSLIYLISSTILIRIPLSKLSSLPRFLYIKQSFLFHFILLFL